MYTVFCYIIAAAIVFCVGAIPLWGVGAFLAWDAHWMARIPDMTVGGRLMVAVAYAVSLWGTAHLADKIEAEF